jgi:hypothetical protein
MAVVVIDIFCVILFIAGVAVALNGARAARGHEGEPPPATYISRIAGTMMAIFALALGSMITLYAVLSS